MNPFRISTTLGTMLLCGLAQVSQAIPIYPTLSLPSSYSNLRMVQGGSATPGESAIVVGPTRSTVEGSFNLSSPTMTVVPSSGTVRRRNTRPIPFSFGWNDTSTLGPHADGIITLDGMEVDPLHRQMVVSGTVVANRQLTIGSIGTPTTAARVMKRSPVTTTISTGNDPVADSDDYATRINTVPRGRVSLRDNNTMKIAYAGTPLPQFNAPGQSADLDVTFFNTGNFNQYYDVAPALLSDGESSSAGAAVQAANLYYNVDVLEQRRLRASGSRVNFGNVLKGAVATQEIMLLSRNRNPDLHHTTQVTVAAKGSNPIVTTVGNIDVASTLVDRDGVPMAVTGTFNHYGKLRNQRGFLSVTTAESGIDAKPYRDLRMSYSVNVGLARIGRRSTFDRATVLSAFIAKSAPSDPRTLAGLASKVDARRSLATDMTSPGAVTEVTYNSRGRLSRSNLRSLYDTVGSEAEIVTSTETTADALVTMQWRRRTYEESRHPRAAGPLPITPGESPKWLTSDVVKIEGVTSDVIYALQMTFDNRINLALDGQVNGQLDKEWQDMWIAEMNSSETMWERTALGSGHFESLSDFLAANAGKTLQELEGNWGVDPNLDTQGRGRSWAIIRGGGSGIFAVVPEPATLILMLSAMFGATAYIVRRHRIAFQMTSSPMTEEVSVDG